MLTTLVQNCSASAFDRQILAQLLQVAARLDRLLLENSRLGLLLQATSA